MGFKYKKRAGRCVHEHTNIVAKHHEFLWQVRKVRVQGRPIIYLDETWVNQHHSCARAWEDAAAETAMPEPRSGKGKWLILLHAGSSTGFLPEECKLLFVGKKKRRQLSQRDECHALRRVVAMPIAAKPACWWSDSHGQCVVPYSSDRGDTIANLQCAKGGHAGLAYESSHSLD